MALRKILIQGDELLRKKSKPVTEFDNNLHTLLDDMADTLKTVDGVGLAAPQVGVLKQVFIVYLDDIFYEIVNPQIIAVKDNEIDEEGCLSVPNLRGKVKRPLYLRLKYQDRSGKESRMDAEGLLARVICHENDHLNGVLFVDKMQK